MRRALTLVPLVAVLLLPACSLKHTRNLSCHATAVAPQSQPDAATPKAALTWYLAHLAKAQHLPTTGYQEEGRGPTRVVYRDTTGLHRIGVGNFGTAGKPNWAVENTIAC